MMRKLMLVLGVFSSLCLIGCFFALSDIHKDYVSPQVLQNVAVNADVLPVWTACSTEWFSLFVGCVVLILFHLLALIYLFRSKG